MSPVLEIVARHKAPKTKISSNLNCELCTETGRVRSGSHIAFIMGHKVGTLCATHKKEWEEMWKGVLGGNV